MMMIVAEKINDHHVTIQSTNSFNLYILSCISPNQYTRYILHKCQKSDKCQSLYVPPIYMTINNDFNDDL